MTTELRPLGVLCNIQCVYCYQNPQRDAGNTRKSYDLERMKLALEKEGGPFTLFGGEPLLLPIEDLETLWAWGLERFGSNALQTNGTMISDAHIALFKKYKVHIGISIDGPEELNDARFSGSINATRRATAKTEAAIDRLLECHVVPSLIVTLHRLNAGGGKLDRMNEWFMALDAKGVRVVRLHILENESASIRNTYALSMAENIEAFLNFARLERSLPKLRFDVYQDMRQILLGNDDNVTCVWRSCDPYTTQAVRGVEGFGQSSNCGRTNKEGIDFLKTDTQGFERYLALYHTDQSVGGCHGCRFFMMCKGQCPGTSIDGDWRNRSEYCDVWKALFSYFESELADAGYEPISKHPRRRELEQKMLKAWIHGNNPTISSLISEAGGHRRA
jgi:radical SAM protein with 4Fe4S-binding SPASM domain